MNKQFKVSKKKTVATILSGVHTDITINEPKVKRIKFKEDVTIEVLDVVNTSIVSMDLTGTTIDTVIVTPSTSVKGAEVDVRFPYVDELDNIMVANLLIPKELLVIFTHCGIDLTSLDLNRSKLVSVFNQLYPVLLRNIRTDKLVSLINVSFNNVVPTGEEDKLILELNTTSTRQGEHLIERVLSDSMIVKYKVTNTGAFKQLVSVSNN